MVDQKQELLRTIKVKNLRGYHFSFKEDGNQAVASMTNSAVQNLINLDGPSKGLTLSYTKVKDKKKKTTRTFKCEVKTDGSSVTFLVRDLNSNRMISKNLFPPPTSHHDSEFQTLEQCIQDFRCKHGGELQCEANRTCKPHFAALTCCLKDGTCYSMHFVFHPTLLRCQILSNVPALEGLVLSQR